MSTSSSASIFDNYENSLRDSLGSVTDFGVTFDDRHNDSGSHGEEEEEEEENVWREGVCNNAIVQQACNIFTISNERPVIIVENNSHSEA